MNWSMPRPVVQVVAVVLAVSCFGAFTLAAIGAPPRGRLPGEGVGGASGEVLEAQDATPLLTDERIQGAAVAEELTAEEKAELEAEKKAKAEAAALARAEADKGAAAGPESAPMITALPPPPMIEAAPPPPPKAEEPPF